MIHVPYKGGGPAMTDLLGGRIAMYAGGALDRRSRTSRPASCIALATTGAQRTPMMPNVPTVAESGYPGFEAINWYAFVASSKMPKEILDFWNRELVKVLKDPVRRRGARQARPRAGPGTREELARYIERENGEVGPGRARSQHHGRLT